MKKTKELIIDFRRHNEALPLLKIRGEEVERVPSFKCLGTYITEYLTCTINSTALVQRKVGAKPG